MGQYIPVATPIGKAYQHNLALKRIITYIGGEYKKRHSGIRVQMMSDYKAGLNYIDKKCGKGYKGTIRNLMNSKEKHTHFQAGYQKWKFHKQKAEVFFRRLKQVLEKMDADEEIRLLFDQLYTDISKNFPIDKRGSDIVSCPYRAALNQARNSDQYNQNERTALARIESTFPAYDKLYRG